jgi:hypothetical protein
MMGRRPQPVVFHNYVITAGSVVSLPSAGSGQELPPGIRFELDILLVNKGPGIARDLFSNVKVATPGVNCQLWSKPSDDNWIRQRTLISQWQSVVSKDGFKLAPESLALSTGLGLVLVPPFSQQLRLELSCGCDGSPTDMVVLGKSAEEVQRLYQEHLANSRDEATGNRFVKEVLGISSLN